MTAARTLAAESRIIVVCGSGGVGKTTTAAALARQVALTTDKRVLVLTIDPARRLADALGLTSKTGEVVEVPLTSADPPSPDLSSIGAPPATPNDEKSSARGKLFACTLDAKGAWDELIERHAPDAVTRDAIMTNPLYRSLTERFVQSHDYIAMERLYEFHESGAFDLIVIDTPPANHAVDFLEAPQRMADFFDSRVLKFLIAPNRSRLMQVAARPFLQIADRVLGASFLGDITEFFTALVTLRPGFITRANAVGAVLRDDTTQFMVVTTSEYAPRREAQHFVAELTKRKLRLGLVVFNRVLPAFVDDADAVAQAEQWRTNPPATDAREQRVLRTVAENTLHMAALAGAERDERAAFVGAKGAIEVPLVTAADNDVLDRIGAALWGHA